MHWEGPGWVEPMIHLLDHNPAGITQLPALQMMIGATAIIPSADVVTQQGPLLLRIIGIFHRISILPIKSAMPCGLALGSFPPSGWAPNSTRLVGTLQQL